MCNVEHQKTERNKIKNNNMKTPQHTEGKEKRTHKIALSV